jgi:two-component system, LytTR family, sensor histidine kinase AlgZ
VTQNVQTMDFKEKHPPLTEPGVLDPLRAPTMWAVSEGDELSAPRSGAGLQPVVAGAFDLCHVGAVLRVVSAFEAVLLLGTLFGSAGWLPWLMRWALANAQALPGLLAWLVVVCSLKQVLARQRIGWQWALLMGLGALAAAYGHWQFSLVGLAIEGASPWGWDMLAPMACGAAMAGAVMAWLKQREGLALPQQTQARLVELQARIQPHFLFNTLNTAMALVQIDPDRAEAVLEDLAELFRRALASPSTRASLADELDLARRYLSIEQLRFGERLRINWVLDETATTAVVPNLLLQPLVENAIKHGVERSPEGGWVRVQTQVKAGRVHITVSNSVPDAATPESRRGHGIALRNVRQRVLLMHDVEAQFEAGLQAMIDGPAGVGGGQCYVVRISMPMGAPA